MQFDNLQLNNRVKMIFKDILSINPAELEKADSDKPLTELDFELDSVDIIGLIAGIQKEFKISFDDADLTIEDVKKFSFNSLIEFLKEQIRKTEAKRV